MDRNGSMEKQTEEQAFLSRQTFAPYKYFRADLASIDVMVAKSKSKSKAKSKTLFSPFYGLPRMDYNSYMTLFSPRFSNV